VFTDGDIVVMSGNASDAEDGDLSALMQWHSSLDGPLGQGASVSRVLSLGDHIISASVTDSDGFQPISEPGITVSVTPPPGCE
jgi:hypothetical protein